MRFCLTAEEEKFREEVRDFLKCEATPEMIAETMANGGLYGGPEGRKFIQKVGAKGWLTPTWPRKYGGIEAPEWSMYMIHDELPYWEAPWAYIGARMSGPTILRFANDELKDEFLPKIASGEIEMALGYTEPEAGSDLASLQMRAEDKGDYFLMNGQKVFNSHCHIADYHWLAARTDTNGPKHRGISMFIVDMHSPGITIRPLITVAGWRTNEVFYDNVKVPKRNLVGEMNRGFYYLMTALDFERMFPMGAYRRLFDDVVEYIKTEKRNGIPLSKDPIVRQQMADIAIDIEVTYLLYYQLSYLLDKEAIPNYQSSMQKLFSTEAVQRLTNTAMQVVGLYGQLQADSKWAPLAGRIEYYYRNSLIETIYGGTSEIQRNIIATRGLGLPIS